MSCGHGCGHGHYPSNDRDWFLRGDWPDDPRRVGRDRTWSRVDDESAVEVLEMRLAGLYGRSSAWRPSWPNSARAP